MRRWRGEGDSNPRVLTDNGLAVHRLTGLGHLRSIREQVKGVIKTLVPIILHSDPAQFMTGRSDGRNLGRQERGSLVNYIYSLGQNTIPPSVRGGNTKTIIYNMVVRGNARKAWDDPERRGMSDAGRDRKMMENQDLRLTACTLVSDV